MSARKVDGAVEQELGEALSPGTDAHHEAGHRPQTVLVMGRGGHG